MFKQKQNSSDVALCLPAELIL